MRCSEKPRTSSDSSEEGMRGGERSNNEEKLSDFQVSGNKNMAIQIQMKVM